MEDIDGRTSASERRTPQTTRRRYPHLAAGTSVATGLSHEAAAQAEILEFGGEVAGWQGRAPASIEGETNPTLQLQAGTEIVGTETMSDQGESLELTFTATPEMATCICTIHPTTMVGDMQVQGGAQANGGGGGGVSPDALLLVGTILMMFLSPIAFAVLLYMNRNRGGGGAAASVDD